MLFLLLKENDESLQSRGRKRAAPRGRGRGSTQPSKRGKKSDNSAINRMFMNKDDEDDDDEDLTKRFNKPLPRVVLSLFYLFTCILKNQCEIYYCQFG